MENCGCFRGGIILNPHGKPECCKKPGDDEKFLNNIVLKAWQEADYRNLLLTFEHQQTIDWEFYDASERAKMLKDTSDAFKKIKDPYGSYKPIVLSNEQFERGIYQMKDDDERVFRLPDKPIFLDPIIKNDPKLAKQLAADISLFLINTHICGM